MFLYYLPDVKQLTGEVLEAFGLASRLGTIGEPADAARIGGGPIYKRPARREEPAGSEQAGGGILCGLWQPGLPDLKLDAEQQTWVWIPAEEGRPEYAIGWWNSSRPTARTLARPTQIDGEPALLGDGGEWVVPVARVPPSDTRLPLSLQWTGGPSTGSVVARVAPAWEWLWALSGAVWMYWFTRAGNQGLTQRYRWAADILSANYRVGPVECGTLGLFTTDTIDEILRIVIDATRFEEFLTEPAGQSWLREMHLIREQEPAGALGESDGGVSLPPAATNISPGPVGDLPGTGPAAPN